MQDDLNLYILHMLEDKFLLDIAQICFAVFSVLY